MDCKLGLGGGAGSVRFGKGLELWVLRLEVLTSSVWGPRLSLILGRGGQGFHYSLLIEPRWLEQRLSARVRCPSCTGKLECCGQS